MKLFAKVGRDSGKFFSKVSRGANKSFGKSSGAAKFFNNSPENLHKLGSGLGSASHVLRDVETVGNKVVTAVRASPFGTVLAPVTDVAGVALAGVGAASKLAALGKQATRLRGDPGQVTTGLLEKAKQAHAVGVGAASNFK
jgi:hypothetical protein